jgi:hypothetical protein
MPTITFYIRDEFKQILDKYPENRQNWSGVARAAFEDTVLAGASQATRDRLTAPQPTRVTAARQEFLRSLNRVPVVLTRAERTMIRVALDYYRREHPAGEVTDTDLEYLMRMVSDPTMGNTVDLAELRKLNASRSMHTMLLESREADPRSQLKD